MQTGNFDILREKADVVTHTQNAGFCLSFNADTHVYNAEVRFAAEKMSHISVYVIQTKASPSCINYLWTPGNLKLKVVRFLATIGQQKWWKQYKSAEFRVPWI